MDIQEAIKILANTDLEVYCKVCTVDSVDKSSRTINVTPIDGSAPLLDVNLQANQNSEHGIVSFPAQDSFVVVAFLNNAASVVVLVDEIDSTEIVVGNTKIDIKDGEVIFNEGTFGLVKVDKMVKWMGEVYADLQTLSKTLLGLGVPITITTSAPIQSYFEDTKIKH